MALVQPLSRMIEKHVAFLVPFAEENIRAYDLNSSTAARSRAPGPATTDREGRERQHDVPAAEPERGVRQQYDL
jgi:hypothetical protein